ncbi:histidine phosphatase family protein [Candidatus Gracilibacteria bacterium]|nr:histidine phosphatase family protein [Candidatus Gracilibacteria bacterium]
MTRHIYFIRHAQTDANHQNILMGGRADSPLTEEGQKSAIVLGKGLRDLPLERVYVSSNTRAQDTAKIIFADRNVPVIVSDQIKEQDFGVMTGTQMKDIPADIDQQYREDPYHFSHKEGESMSALKERVGAFMKSEIERSPYTHIAIVSHENVIRAAIAYMKDIDREVMTMKINNCSITHYIYDEAASYHAVRFNYTYGRATFGSVGRDA